MVRVEGYGILEKMGERAVCTARMASAMLVSGQRSADREQRRIQTEVERAYSALVQGLLGASCAVGERAAMARVGAALRRVVHAATEVAALLRGRSVRTWTLLDRVRTSVVQTERLVSLIGGHAKGEERSVQIRDFCEQSVRLSQLEELFFERFAEDGESEVALLLSQVLCEWRAALTEAFDSTVALLLEFAT